MQHNHVRHWDIHFSSWYWRHHQHNHHYHITTTNNHYHPPLSPPPLEHLRMKSWFSHRTKASFSHLPLSFCGKSRKKASFTPSPVTSNNSFRKHLSPAMSSACLLLIWTSKVRQEKLFFSERCASVWPSGRQGCCEFLVIVSLSFRLSFETPGWIKVICQTLNVGNSSGNSYCIIYIYINKYIYISTLSWTKLAATAEIDKHKLQKEQGKEWHLEHPHWSCRKAKRCSFPFFSIMHCH